MAKTISRTHNIKELAVLGNLLNKEPTQGQQLTATFIQEAGLKGHTYLVEHAQTLLVEKFPFQGLDTFKGLGQDSVALGSYAFLKHAVGSVLLHKQPENPQYSAFVPLVLQGYKKYANVPYSKWGVGIKKHISPELLTAVVALGSEPKPVTDAEWLKARETMLENSRFNSHKSMSSPKGGPVDLKNNYANCMYWQTWLAHPEIIHKDMLFYLDTPDVLPEPYVKVENMVDREYLSKLVTEALKESKKVTVEYSETPPWEA